VIVATIGRPTLERALYSIKPQPDDEVVVCCKKNVDVWALCVERDFHYVEYPYDNSVLGGAAERQYGLEHATGDYLVFLDDDDVMADDGLEIIREEIKKLERPLPLLFRVQIPGGFIWSEKPSLTYGEVTGSQFVCPRVPTAKWQGANGDTDFIFQTINLWGSYKPADKVIIRCRPEQINE
jgi:glycosyltransferase involved in cell wall biosynthesis